MLNVEQVKIFLQEENYPYFSDDQLEAMCNLYDDMNELCYVACMMKADAQDITVGPISIKNNSQMWQNLAQMFYKKWMANPSGASTISKSLTGKCVGRADEY